MKSTCWTAVCIGVALFVATTSQILAGEPSEEKQVMATLNTLLDAMPSTMSM
jgi:hypothetical protein